MKRLFLSAVLLAMASALRAEDHLVQTIPPFPGSCSSTPYGETCLHVFGGMKTRIPLPEAQKKCEGLKVQLYQLSTRLRAPVGKPVALSGSDCDTVTLYLPDVTAVTALRIAYIRPQAHEDADAAELPAREILLMVYPKDLLSPLKDWSQANHLIVNDRDNQLIPVLEQQHIDYSRVVLSGDDGGIKQVCIWVPQRDAADEEPPLDCRSLLVLHEKSEGLPFIRVVNKAARARTDIYMPLLRALASNPLVQKTFIDLVQSSL